MQSIITQKSIIVQSSIIPVKIDKVCASVFSQARGLMFSKKKTLLFVFKDSRRISLHNFFVFYPINLIFLDENKAIIEIKNNFRPFAFYTSKSKARYLIEIPCETNINYNKLKEKDKVRFVF